MWSESRGWLNLSRGFSIIVFLGLFSLSSALAVAADKTVDDKAASSQIMSAQTTGAKTGTSLVTDPKTGTSQVKVSNIGNSQVTVSKVVMSQVTNPQIAVSKNHTVQTVASQGSAPQAVYANLPLDLYINAVSEKLEYIDNFNYIKRGRISNLENGLPRPHIARHLVDKVVVYKSHYRMELLKDGKVVRKYWIALSDRPEGDKQYEGDRRTPEGVYTLDYVKERSYYYRAFHISYPNPDDIAEARKLGRRPGGMIMVHGQPPSNEEYEDSVQRSNWTNGCIAILNHEIDEFIELVDPGTPIEIKP